jgi:hypothetical protein
MRYKYREILRDEGRGRILPSQLRRHDRVPDTLIDGAVAASNRFTEPFDTLTGKTAFEQAAPGPREAPTQQLATKPLDLW